MSNEHYKTPRLYCAGHDLSPDQAHYLQNVLRKKPGDPIRVFDGENGEYLAEISALSKKSGSLTRTEQLREQPQSETAVHLLFAPLKKKRMDQVIEKCTELGVTDFHPILTKRTEVRKLKPERLQAQIIEACEQSERLTVPTLHDLCPLEEKITQWNETPQIFGGLERANAPHLNTISPSPSYAFLIGPVGGFDDNEHEFLSEHPVIQPVSLGTNILRAETASIICASFVQFQQ